MRILTFIYVKILLEQNKKPSKLSYMYEMVSLDTAGSLKIQKNNGIKNRKTAFSTGLTPGPLTRFICRNSLLGFSRRSKKGRVVEGKTRVGEMSLSLVSYSRGRGPIRGASLYTRLLLTFVIIF